MFAKTALLLLVAVMMMIAMITTVNGDLCALCQDALCPDEAEVES